jgi:type I restriction enzyme S subunit
LLVKPDPNKLNVEFLKLLIQDSELLRKQLLFQSNATTIEVIYSYTIATVFIPVPPKAEQAEVKTFLDVETAKLDTLTAEAQRAMDLLKERRSALISAAVTGKIDVRGYHAQPQPIV